MLEFTHSQQGAHHTFTLKGALAFDDRTLFSTLMGELAQSTDICELNLANVEFIDSAGLGMLLLLKEKAAQENFSVVLSYPYGQVKKMLELSEFTEIFTLITDEKKNGLAAG